MKQTSELLKQEFESSSGLTPQFSLFLKTFKREITRELKSPGCKNIIIGRGHFEVSVFFTAKSGQWWYLHLSDVRWFKTAYIRTAKGCADYTGGRNISITIDETLSEQLKSLGV